MQRNLGQVAKVLRLLILKGEHSFATAPEILQYFLCLAKKHDLYKFVNLNHQVTAAKWQETEGIWQVTVKDLTSGVTRIDWCHFLINGSGILKY